MANANEFRTAYFKIRVEMTDINSPSWIKQQRMLEKFRLEIAKIKIEGEDGAKLWVQEIER